MFDLPYKTKEEFALSVANDMGGISLTGDGHHLVRKITIRHV